MKRSGVSFPTSPLPRVTPYPGVANLRSRYHSIPAPIRLCLSRCCHARPSLFSPSRPRWSTLNTLQRCVPATRTLSRIKYNCIDTTNCECECKSCTARRPCSGPAQTRGSTSTRTCALYYFTSLECIAIDTPTAKCWLKILTWGKCVDQLAPTLQLLIHAQSPAQADLHSCNAQYSITHPRSIASLESRCPQTLHRNKRHSGSRLPGACRLRDHVMSLAIIGCPKR